MTGLTALVMGFLLGIRHATEADHLAAVATLVAREKSLRQAARQGMAWGIGHTLTLAAFGGAVLALGSRVPDSLARGLEIAVGVMLVLLGIDVIRRLRRERTHFHVHAHEDGRRHVHLHSHTGDGPHAVSRHAHEHRQQLPWRATLVGMVHGMAGSAALVLLSLATVSSPLAGLAYIGMFGIGSIAGMAVLSAVIAVPMRLSAGRLDRFHAGLTLAVGATSCLLGALTIYQQGFAG